MLDPKTRLEIDVAPFLETLDAFVTLYDAAAAGEGGVTAVRQLLRLLNRTELNPLASSPAQLVERYEDLHRLEALFEATRSRPASGPNPEASDSRVHAVNKPDLANSIREIFQRSEPGCSPGAIWVVDPPSGQGVDVAAFLKAMHEFEPGAGAPLNQGAREALQRIIQFLSLITHDPVTTDFVQLSNIFNDLWRLLAMFESTSSVNSLPHSPGSGGE